MEKYFKKIFKTIEKNKMIERNDKIFVALSGGKDSALTLAALKKYVDTKNIECEISGFHINLNLPGSRYMEEIARKQAEMFGVKLKILDLKELNISILEASKISGRPICSICGLTKRYFMNKIPRENGANKVATGHNMDDFIVFFIKNFINRNFQWISKFKPILKSKHPKMIVKIRPLFETGGDEIEMICKHLNIPYAAEFTCPYKYTSRFGDERTRIILKAIYDLEREIRNFRIKMIRAVEAISDKFEVDGELKSCKICGEPCSGNICAFCKLFKLKR